MYRRCEIQHDMYKCIKECQFYVALAFVIFIEYTIIIIVYSINKYIKTLEITVLVIDIVVEK